MTAILSRRRVGAAVFLLALDVTGCDRQSPEANRGGDACRVAQPPTALDTRIPESSGAAISRQQRGVIWTHNDSGAEAELFAVHTNGELAGTVTLEGARHRDWEDIAVADCPLGSCLYVADIGDNAGRRSTVDIYRLREPEPGTRTPVPTERFSVRYPDGPRDAEALFILPPERLFVVTRGRGDPIAVYAVPGPLRPDTTVELEHVRTLSTAAVPHDDQVTGADATADGRWIVLRTPSSLYFYTADQLLPSSRDAGRAGTPLEAGANPPIRAGLNGIGEVQGEGVAAGDNGVVVLTSEGFGGMQGAITVLWCGMLK